MAARRLTISDIKYDTMANEPHFFDRKTMKFFGQTMRDFHVYKSPKGKIFILAKRKYGGYTMRQYVPGKKMGYGELRSVDVPGGVRLMDYIKAH